jgi:hypothetical protein
MVTDQKHSSDSTPRAKLVGLDKQHAEVYSVLLGQIRALEKRLDDYYSQHKRLKKKVNRLGKYIEERVDWLILIHQ